MMVKDMNYKTLVKENVIIVYFPNTPMKLEASNDNGRICMEKRLHVYLLWDH